MKKIIVEGDTNLRKCIRQCPNCGCQFQYTNDEVYKVEDFNKTFSCKYVNTCVECPWCLEEIRLSMLNDHCSSLLEDAKRMLDKYTQK